MNSLTQQRIFGLFFLGTRPESPIFAVLLVETAIDILGIHVQEPVTIFTNFLISLSCVYMYFKLHLDTERAELKKYWRLFFLYFGINAGIGIIAHGFKSYFSDNAFYYIWMSMNLASVPVTFYLLKADVENSKIGGGVKSRLNIIIFISSLVFVAFTILLNNFVVVKISALISILTTIVVHFITFRRGSAGSGYITAGFAVSISALIVHGAKLSVSEWFNFKDISHVIMNISLIMIFIGVQQKLRSASAEPEQLVSGIPDNNEETIEKAIA